MGKRRNVIDQGPLIGYSCVFMRVTGCDNVTVRTQQVNEQMRKLH